MCFSRPHPLMGCHFFFLPSMPAQPVILSLYPFLQKSVSSYYLFLSKCDVKEVTTNIFQSKSKSFSNFSFLNPHVLTDTDHTWPPKSLFSKSEFQHLDCFFCFRLLLLLSLSTVYHKFSLSTAPSPFCFFSQMPYPWSLEV